MSVGVKFSTYHVLERHLLFQPMLKEGWELSTGHRSMSASEQDIGYCSTCRKCEMMSTYSTKDQCILFPNVSIYNGVCKKSYSISDETDSKQAQTDSTNNEGCRRTDIEAPWLRDDGMHVRMERNEHKDAV